MKDDCEAKAGDENAIRDLFDNIEAVCEVKGFDIVLEITSGVCTTTGTTTETTTTEPTTTETTTQTTTTEPTTTETTTTEPTTTETTTTEPTTTEITTQTTTCIISDPCGALEIAPFTEASISSCCGTFKCLITFIYVVAFINEANMSSGMPKSIVVSY